MTEGSWRCIAQAEKRCTLAGGMQSVRVEKLFVHEMVLVRIKPLLDDLAGDAARAYELTM